MDWKRDKEAFDHTMNNRCGGSTYQAIQHLSKLARKKLKELDNSIQDSQALTWALTGVKPDVPETKHKKVYHSNRFYQEEYMNDILCCVDDKEVCESVRESFRASKQVNHLIYVYNNTLDESRKSRVRILTRMIWYYTIK